VHSELARPTHKEVEWLWCDAGDHSFNLVARADSWSVEAISTRM